MGVNSSKPLPIWIDDWKVGEKDVKSKWYDDENRLQESPWLRTMLRPLECPICFEIFDNQNHAPCTLSCGHSICIHHTKCIKSCPICRCRIPRDAKLKKSVALSETAVALTAVASCLGAHQEIFKSTKYKEAVEFAMQCPVCWMKFDDGRCHPCTVSSCGHSFCLRHCSDFKTKRCPICREPFDRLKKSTALGDVSRKLQDAMSNPAYTTTPINPPPPRAVVETRGCVPLVVPNLKALLVPSWGF